MSVMRTKNIDALLLGVETKGLEKSLGALDMTLLDIGCIIGTGIMRFHLYYQVQPVRVCGALAYAKLCLCPLLPAALILTLMLHWVK